MTIEGASAAEDKNGDLLGFATTDEIGSVMDMTKTKNFYENDDGLNGYGRRRGRGGRGGWEDDKDEEEVEEAKRAEGWDELQPTAR